MAARNRTSHATRRPPSQALAPSIQTSVSLPTLGGGGGRASRQPGAAPALQWLPPTQLHNQALNEDASLAAEAMIMASWHNDLAAGAQKSKFGSGILFLELQLREALAATAAAAGKPDAFRTACVCECLGRLPDAATSGFSNVLQLLRQELLSAVYVDYEKLARGRGGRPIDAQELLNRPTFFTECEKLRQKCAAFEERFADWEKAKGDLAQDSEGRNELLRLAATKWNAVMSALKADGGTIPEAMAETSRKLSGLLDSMLQHSKAIDELQRLSLLEPQARMLAQFNGLSHATRRKLLLSLLKSHAGAALSSMSNDERVTLFHTLVISLNLHERQELMRSLVTHEGIVGPAATMLNTVLSQISPEDASVLLRQQLELRAWRLESRVATRVLREEMKTALHAAGHLPMSDEKGVQEGSTQSTLPHVEVQTAELSDNMNTRANILSQAANATGPESVAALPDAIAMLEEEIAAIKKARPLKAYEKTDATALMPLVKALELRCEVLSDENKRLKGMKEAMKVRSS